MFSSSLIRALDGYELDGWEPSDAPRVRAMTARLADALGGVVDGRRRQGRRHGLAAVAMLSVLCVLAGVRKSREAHRWASRLPVAIRCGVGLRGGRVPSRSAWENVLGGLDAESLEDAVAVFVQHLAARARQQIAHAARPARPPLVHLAVDGKVLRGGRDRADAGALAPVLVVVYEPGTGAVLAQDQVTPGKGKGGEIVAARRGLDRVEQVTDMVVSLDALHCQDATAEYLTGRGAHYVIGLKGNRKKLSGQARALPWDQILTPAFSDDGIGHGRSETREVRVLDVPDGFDLPGARRIVQVVRTRKKTRRRGPGRRRVFYYVTSLDHRQASAGDLAHVIRRHWGVEVLHWVRDAVLGEDAHTARTGALPRVWAILRNLAITLLRLAGRTRYKEAFEDHRQDPWAALTVLT